MRDEMKIYMMTDLEEIALTARGKSVFIGRIDSSLSEETPGTAPDPPPAAG